MTLETTPFTQRAVTDCRGSALLPVLLLMFLFAAVSIGIATVVRIETTVGARFVEAAGALYAADAGINLAMSEMRTLPDWTGLLSGAAQSVVSQGAFAGAKRVPGGGTVLTCCGPSSVVGRLERESAASPLAPRAALPWRPFLWCALDQVAPRSPPSRLFLAVFIKDDEEDGDGDGARDANGRVVVRSEAVHPDGLRRAVEALVERHPGDPLASVAPAVRLLRWREVR
jgi:hypothetical protein